MSATTPRRRLLLGIAAAALAALLAAAPRPGRAEEPRRPLELSTFPRTALEITRHDAGQAPRKYQFQVWIADTPERAEQGLMFVSDLPESMGMVFPVEPPRVETMWMKNTYIELDMLFIAADGRVTKIIANAAPMSLKTLSSDAPVAAVLELKGGQAARLGVHVGDTVQWKKPAH